MVTKAQRARTARQPEVIDVEISVEHKRNKFYEAQQEYLQALGIPTERRAFVAFAIGVGTSMAVGVTMTKITTMAMVGAALLTGSMFLSMMIWIIGCILSIYASIRTFHATFNYVAEGHIDRDVLRIKQWSEDKVARARGWFNKQQERFA
jgi:hypothetical protein